MFTASGVRGLVGVLLLALPLWLLSGCATLQEGKEGAGLVTGHFVGDANPSVAQHTFVAIAASGADHVEHDQQPGAA
jgi:regulator of protease activity HflC (stomatin/prohibitin superfamily)